MMESLCCLERKGMAMNVTVGHGFEETKRTFCCETQNYFYNGIQ